MFKNLERKERDLSMKENIKEKFNEGFQKFLCKISDITKSLKKNFKKSEIAIYAIALMLVAAGYFNYTTFENETIETYSEDVSNISNEHTNIGDAVLVSNNEVEDIKDEENNEANQTVVDSVAEETNENKINSTSEGQSIETSSNETLDDTNYYANTKLERDKMYAQMIANYENLLNNSNVSEVQKSIITEEITKINNTKNAIMICENLILTKGFQNCAILINEESVNIVVSIENGLNTEQVAKIQNIVSRELGTQIENIHITEK